MRDDGMCSLSLPVAAKQLLSCVCMLLLLVVRSLQMEWDLSFFLSPSPAKQTASIHTHAAPAGVQFLREGTVWCV